MLKLVIKTRNAAIAKPMLHIIEQALAQHGYQVLNGIVFAWNPAAGRKEPVEIVVEETED